MLDRLTGKVAVVTGASRGIGRAIALRLAQEGAAVVINYNGSKERAQEVKTEIESAGGTAQIMQCDVADAASCDEMFQTIIKEFGRIDILVNNAGITRDGLLMKMAEEDFDAVIGLSIVSVQSQDRCCVRDPEELLTCLLYQEFLEMQDRLIILHQRLE